MSLQARAALNDVLLSVYCEFRIALSVTEIYILSWPMLVSALLKPNSITLAGSELAPNMFGASSEPASVMEFGFYRPFCGPGSAVGLFNSSVCVLVCVFARQLSSELTSDLDVRRGSSQRKSVPFSAESESVKLGNQFPKRTRKPDLN